jgi:hypothetical protein
MHLERQVKQNCIYKRHVNFSMKKMHENKKFLLQQFAMFIIRIFIAYELTGTNSGSNSNTGESVRSKRGVKRVSKRLPPPPPPHNHRSAVSPRNCGEKTIKTGKHGSSSDENILVIRGCGDYNPCLPSPNDGLLTHDEMAYSYERDVSMRFVDVRCFHPLMPLHPASIQLSQEFLSK